MKIEFYQLMRSGNHMEGKALERIKVFGGWVLRSMDWSLEDHVQTESMVFIPDPNHEWTIDE